MRYTIYIHIYLFIDRYLVLSRWERGGSITRNQLGFCAIYLRKLYFYTYIHLIKTSFYLPTYLPTYPPYPSQLPPFAIHHRDSRILASHKVRPHHLIMMIHPPLALVTPMG
jgi:hypothetical protein